MGQQMEPQQLFPEQEPEIDYNDFSSENSFNSDPREQPVMMEGPFYGQKLQPVSERPRQRQRRSSFWFPLIPLVLAFLIIGGMGALFSHAARVSPPEYFFKHPMPMKGDRPFNDNNTFPVFGGVPNVIINGASGNISIQAGKDGQVTVQPGSQGSQDGNPGDFSRVFAAQDGNTITITAPPQFNNNATLTVVVPANANIVINGGAEAVSINGVSGQINVNVPGSINMQQVALAGSSNFHTVDGSITFQGVIAAGSQVEIDTGSGSVNVQLPGSETFNIVTSTNGGSVNNQFTNDLASSTSLRINTDSGSITISKG